MPSANKLKQFQVARRHCVIGWLLIEMFGVKYAILFCLQNCKSVPLHVRVHKKLHVNVIISKELENLNFQLNNIKLLFNEEH